VSGSDDLRAATDPSTEPDRLLVLAAARRVEVRAAVARNPATPAAALRSLVADKNAGVRHAAVESGRREAWEAAVTSDNDVTRVVLGQQPGLDEDIIAALVSDPAVHVRRQVAYGTESRAALEALLDDPEAAVKAEAVRNRHLLPADAERLATDPDPVVRAAVAYSPMTPVALSKGMVRDRDRRVRGGALARLPLSPEERAHLNQLRQRLRDLEEQRARPPLDPSAIGDPQRWRERLYVGPLRTWTFPMSNGYIFIPKVHDESRLYADAASAAWDSVLQEQAWSAWFEQHLEALHASPSTRWYEDRTDLSIRRHRRQGAVSVGIPVVSLRSSPDVFAYLRSVQVDTLAALADVLGLPHPPELPS
jgi:hypothetical protein